MKISAKLPKFPLLFPFSVFPLFRRFSRTFSDIFYIFISDIISTSFLLTTAQKKKNFVSNKVLKVFSPHLAKIDIVVRGILGNMCLVVDYAVRIVVPGALVIRLYYDKRDDSVRVNLVSYHTLCEKKSCLLTTKALKTMVANGGTLRKDSRLLFSKVRRPRNILWKVDLSM